MSTLENDFINDFLPDDYSVPVNSGWYTKIVKDEEVRIRILSKPIIGYSYFSAVGDKRKQIHSKEFPTELVNPAINKFTNAPETPQEFWAMKVYNYNTESIEIFDTTKNPIKSAILNLSRDPDYGNPMSYDIKIKKTGVDTSTRYFVLPTQIKPLASNIETLANDTYVNLEALYTGDNPFMRTTPIEDVSDLTMEELEQSF